MAYSKEWTEEEEIVCPMISSGNVLILCMKDKCRWWIEDPYLENKCSIKDLTISLNRIACNLRK